MTIKPSEVTRALVDLYEANRAALGVQQVFYGDVEQLAKFPCIAVVTGPLRRSWAGAQTRTDNNFVVYLMVYHGGIRDPHLTQESCDQLAETVVDLAHTDIRLGGLVIASLVTSIEPGFSPIGNNLTRSTRIEWTGYTKTGLLG